MQNGMPLTLPIQGSAADIIKVAMSLIYRRLQSNNLKAKMILQVRRTEFQRSRGRKRDYTKIVIEEMERAYRMLVPLESRFRVGKELAGSALIRSITLFNLQSESSKAIALKYSLTHQNIRHLCYRIFFIHNRSKRKHTILVVFDNLIKY